jgi:hypothetical protein
VPTLTRPDDRVSTELGRLMRVEGRIAVSLVVCLQEERGGKSPRRSLGLRALISRWRALVEDRSPGSSNDLADRLDRWRRARNRLVLALGAEVPRATATTEVERLRREGKALVTALGEIRSRRRDEAPPPCEVPRVQLPAPAPAPSRRRTAIRYEGRIGFWRSPIKEVFTEGPVAFTRHPGLGVAMTAGERRRPMIFKPVDYGWMSPTRSSRFTDRIRRYVDAMGEMWWCELHRGDDAFTRLVRVPYGQGTAASADFDAAPTTWLEAPLRSAVERDDPAPTLVLEVDYESEELEVVLASSEQPAWVGSWRQRRPPRRDIRADLGAVRGRLFRDGRDALFVGEWRQMDATYTCVVALDHERDVYT